MMRKENVQLALIVVLVLVSAVVVHINIVKPFLLDK
jgi:hypothetical protein